MPLDVFDIHDRCEVLHIREIEAGAAQCRADHIDYIPQIGTDRVMPVAKFIVILKARWHRACATAQQIEAIRAGFCTITDAAAPVSSDARH
jgi:hypothetical protein